MKEQTRPFRRLPRRREWLEYLGSGLLALLLSLTVWVMAVYEQDPPRTDYFERIPIRYINLGPDLVRVGNVEEYVRVTIRAPSSAWPTLTSDAVEATVDLQGLGVGIHNVDVKVRVHEKTAMVVQSSPVRVVVRLEECIEREVDVRTVVADPETVPLGYEMGPPQVEPQKVTLRGPRSLVESVSEVVATVWLRGSKTAVESQVTPVALDAEARQVGDDVDLTPQTVNVMLPVMPLAEFRDLTVKARVVGAPAAGYWVSNISVEPAAVTVQGKPEVIRSMPAVVSTEPIDVTGVKESVTRRVSLELPEDVSVYSADTSTQTVLVRVEVTPIIGGKTIQPTIEVLGLRSGLTATISPDTVDVILSGPMPELQALQVGDVSVVVNLFGLRTGRHMVAPTVVLPEGSSLRVEGMSPEIVEVTISQVSGGTR